MDQDEEECFDAGEELDDMEEEEDDWCTAASSSSYGFDGDSDSGEGLEQCQLEISVPRRQSVSIVFDRSGVSDDPGCDHAGSRRELQISMPKRGSVTLVFERGTEGSVHVEQQQEQKDVAIRGEQAHSDTSSLRGEIGGDASERTIDSQGLKQTMEVDVNSSGGAAVNGDELGTGQDFKTEVSTSKLQVEEHEKNNENVDLTASTADTSLARTGNDTLENVQKQDSEDNLDDDALETGNHADTSVKESQSDDNGDSEKQAKRTKALRFQDPEDTVSGADGLETESQITGEAPVKKSLRFGDTEDNAGPEEQTKRKKALQFQEPDDDSPTKKSKATKSLKFADILDEGENVGAKRNLRFEEPDTHVKHAKIMGDMKSRKSVRFTDDIPGASRKFSISVPVVVRKTVRFLLPTIDSSGKQINRVFFPGVKKRKRRDTIKAPTVEVYPDPPLSLVLYMMDSQRFSHFTGRRRSMAWRLLSWITGALSALAFIACMVMLILYLHLSPRIPNLKINSLDFLDVWLAKLRDDELVQQQIEEKGNYYAYTFGVVSKFTVSYENGNDKLDIYNEYVEVTVFYRGTSWGKAIVGGFLVRRSSKTVLKFVVRNLKLMHLNVGYTIDQDINLNMFDLVFEFVVKARMSRMGRLATPRIFWLRVRCYIILRSQDIESEDCRNYNYVTE